MLKLNERENIQLEKFKKEMNSIFSFVNLQTGNFSKAINLLVSYIEEYKENNMELLEKEFIKEELAIIYIDFINWHSITEAYATFEDELLRLMSPFESAKSKGELIHYLFLHSILQYNEKISQTIINLINKDLKYVVESEDMKLIDSYFVYSFVFKALRRIDTINLYKYIFSLDFSRTEDSIKNTLVLLSFASTGIFVNESLVGNIFLEDSDIIIDKIEFYDFIKEEDIKNIRLALELDSNGNKYIKVYLLADGEVYSVSNIYELYQISIKKAKLLNNSNYNPILTMEENQFNYIDNIKLDLIPGEVRYLFLKDYINNNGFSKTLSDNLIYYTDYIRVHSSINHPDINVFITQEIENNIENHEILQIILDSFDLNHEALLYMYICSLEDDNSLELILKDLISDNYPELIDDINIINNIYN